MSTSLSTVAVEAFDTEVKQVYQGVGVLRDTVTAVNCEGNIHNFRRQEKGMATPHISQSIVVPMGIEHTLIPCLLEGWNASEYTDLFDQSEVNFDEIKTLAYTIGASISRRQDQIIINALNNATTASGPYAGDITSNEFGSGVEQGFTIKKLKRMETLLNEQGVPSGDRYLVTRYDSVDQLLGTTELTSSYYNNIKALWMGDIDYFMGFKFKYIESLRRTTEGGLPNIPSASGFYSFAYHKPSIGLATAIEPTTDVYFAPTRNSHLSIGKINSGSAIIDGKGVVRCGTIGSRDIPSGTTPT